MRTIELDDNKHPSGGKIIRKKYAYRTFVVPATQEAEVERPLEPSVSRPAWATL